ncbi:hypothetical protein [Clostridium algidicarnis]|uniref:hypothetical protein n=1 Tax=Clostridium algidicarnis TaxID=37659 RepID=UPI001C0E63BA|nr:hypothetical protein [Clostridium algidicarnis]MBU3228781.1 hypothetical protein [Clostridium algidicarnis]MBU3252325.1 hypothetical protein [Clostridium algidicarnis]
MNTGAKFDEKAKEAVKEAISNYNTKSLIAKNPKQIVDYSFSADEMTLVIELESEADLPMPTKALRLLSSYLVEETCLDKSLSGKQLFKMIAARAEENIPNMIATVPGMNLEKFKNLSTDDKLIEIYKLLLG